MDIGRSDLHGASTIRRLGHDGGKLELPPCNDESQHSGTGGQDAEDDAHDCGVVDARWVGVAGCSLCRGACIFRGEHHHM